MTNINKNTKLNAKIHKFRESKLNSEVKKRSYDLDIPNIMEVQEFLSEDIKIDELNREPDDEWVNTIVAAQIEYYQKYGNFHYPDVFLICYDNGNMRLLDGQHRRKSLEILSKMDEFKHISTYKIIIRVVEIKDYNQRAMIFNFANVKLVGNSSVYMLKEENGDTPIIKESKIKDEIDFKIKCQAIKKLLVEKYGDKIFAPKLSTKNIVPKISLDDFITNLRSISCIKTMTAEEIYETLVRENDLCCKYMIKSQHPEMIKRCIKVDGLCNNFYLGYYHFYRESKDMIKRTNYACCKWLSLIFI